MFEVNELLGDDYKGDIKDTDYYTRSLEGYMETALIEKYEDCLAKSIREKTTFEDLEKEYHRLNFLVKTNARVQKELEVSIKAGELIGKIYDAILKQYKKLYQ